MSAGEIAGLIAAVAFVVLVFFLAFALIKLGKTLDAATLAIRDANAGAGPLLESAQQTLVGVNTQLETLDGVTRDVGVMTANASALTSIATSTVGTPLIKMASFSYGVRRVLVRNRQAEVAAKRKAARRRGSKS